MKVSERVFFGFLLCCCWVLRMEKAVEYDCYPFSRLPDDIVVQIYNKVMDLKTLCYCQLISKRLGLIVFQADTISFDVPLRFDYENENRLEDMMILYESLIPHIKEADSAGALDSDPALLLGSDSFPSAIKFIKRFTKLKFPSYVNLVAVVDNDGDSFFKWKINFGTRADSLAIQAQNSEDVLEEEEEEVGLDEEREDTDEDEEDILEEEDEVGSDEEREDTDEDGEEKDNENLKSCFCLRDVIDRLKKVLGCTVEFPLLVKIFIMDSNNERQIVTSKHRLIHYWWTR